MRQIQRPCLTFRVDDPHGHHLYTLRQSRYDAVANDINDLARAAALNGKALSVLDVGCGDGTLLDIWRPSPNSVI
jgi:2-polyprenyl-3-methyl-5-hydroxy-6-metoxy-1,4-benzoquinol methylase